MTQNKLSADPLALILGLVSLVLGITGCCCYGIPAIITLVLAIIGLIVANRSIREYEANPEAFSPQTRNNVGTGKIINIIAIVFNGIVVAVLLICFLLYGTLMSTAILKDIHNQTYEYNEYYFEENDTENDRIDPWDDDTHITEEKKDSIEMKLKKRKRKANHESI